MQSRLVNAAKRTFRAEAMLVLFTILITSWSMFALYKLSTGWDGSFSTLFNFSSTGGGVQTTPEVGTLGSKNQQTTDQASSSSSLNDRKLMMLMTNQHNSNQIDYDRSGGPSAYATGQTTIVAREKLIPNLAFEILEANRQLDDEDASSMEFGPSAAMVEKKWIDSSANEIDQSQRKQISQINRLGLSARDDNKSKETNSEEEEGDEHEHQPETTDDSSTTTTTKSKDEPSDYRVNSRKQQRTSGAGNKVAAARYNEPRPPISDDSGAVTTSTPAIIIGDDDNSEEKASNKTSSTSADSDTDDDAENSDNIETNTSPEVTSSGNERGRADNENNLNDEEESARQTGRSIDDEVDKITKPSLEFTNQEDDIEYGNEAVKFDDSPTSLPENQSSSGSSLQTKMSQTKMKGKNKPTLLPHRRGASESTSSTSLRARPDTSGAARNSPEKTTNHRLKLANGRTTTRTTTTTTTTSSTSTTTTQRPPKYPPYPTSSISFETMSDDNHTTNNHDLNFDHNRPSVSLENLIFGHQQLPNRYNRRQIPGHEFGSSKQIS